MTTLQVAQIVRCTEAEGPGRRSALWLQGCPLRCPGCCNPEMLPFEGGESRTVASLLDEVRQSVEQERIEGVTLLGGEPFSHADGAAEFAEQVRELGLTVMIFSGFQLEDIEVDPDSRVRRLLAATDILVDGPYDRTRPEPSRRWIGSANQRIHHLTERSDPNDPRWRTPNTLEVRLVDGEVTVNGFPAHNATGLWRRLGPVRLD